MIKYCVRNGTEYFKKTGEDSVCCWWQPEKSEMAHLYEKEINIVGKLLKTIRGYQKMKYLELGSGDGRVRFWLSKKKLNILPNTTAYTCVDINKIMLKKAKERLRSSGISAEFVEADVHTLPFNNNTFDITLCLNSFVHFEKPTQVIKEIKRVLRKEGVLICNVDNALSIKRLVRNCFNSLNILIDKKYKPRGWNIFRPYRPKEFRKILLEHNFKIINDNFYGFFPPIDAEIGRKRFYLFPPFLSKLSCKVDSFFSFIPLIKNTATYYLVMAKSGG